MRHRLQSFWPRYAIAVVTTATASVIYLHAGLPDVDSDVKYFGFAIAVLISSLTAGLGPGLLATALSACASAFLLLAPLLSLTGRVKTLAFRRRL
jgi:K+-sensing histidine kinase KdpD